MSNITEILRQHQLKQLKRSVAYAETTEKRVHNQSEHAKKVITGQDPNDHVDLDVLVIKNIYYDMLQAYLGKIVSFPVEMNKKSIALWTRVERARSEAGCSAERYLKAQFTWFDKTFGKAPTLEQLATPTAIERAKEFTGNTSGKVLGNIRKAPTSKADIFRAAEQLLQQAMAAQECTREDFYKKFVLTGIYSFPKEFLNADPTYKRLLDE